MLGSKSYFIRRAHMVWAMGFMLFNSACQSRNEAIVNTNHRYKVPVTALYSGSVSPEIKDSDYILSGHLATMSAYIYKSSTDKTHTPTYQDCYKKDRDLAAFFNTWERMSDFPDFPCPPKNNRTIKGLIYDVWVSKRSPKIAVIVFRGTDFKTPGDWLSNLLWITKFVPKQWDQYEQVVDLTPKLVEKITARYGPGVRIFTTGHSLGGGLAMQAGFVTPKIEKIFTFHSSPVDGYKRINSFDTVGYANKRIYRIYEKGEVLSALRFVMKGFKPLSHSNPEVIQVRYNFLRGNTIAKHTLHKFADSLRKGSELPKPD